MSCFQCDLDIPHVCYEGVRNARWGMTEEMCDVLDGVQRHLSDQRRPPTQSKKRRTR